MIQIVKDYCFLLADYIDEINCKITIYVIIVIERLASALNIMNSAVSNPGVPLHAPSIPQPPIPGQIPSILSSIYGYVDYLQV